MQVLLHVIFFSVGWYRYHNLRRQLGDGDFVTVQAMSGGQSASVGVAMNNKLALLLYPAAAADAVILLLVVLVMVG